MKIGSGFVRKLTSRRARRRIAAYVSSLGALAPLRGGEGRWSQLTSGYLLSRGSDFDSGLDALRKVAAQNREWKLAWRTLANALRRHGRRWEEIETLETLTREHPRDVEALTRLAEAREEMNRLELAAETFDQVRTVRPSARIYYRLGYCLERLGREGFREAYSRSVELSGERLGVGAFHEARGFWPEAADAYLDELSRRSLPELHDRAANVLERLYRFEEAVRQWTLALELESTPERRYRLGCAQERIELVQDALDSFSRCLDSTRGADARYRLGACLARLGRFEDACAVFGEMRTPGVRARFGRSKDLVTTEERFRRARAYEASGRGDEAAREYSMAILGLGNHEPARYLAAGRALARVRRYEEACDAFLSTRQFRRESFVRFERRQLKEGVWERTVYAEYRATLPLARKRILFESFDGVAIRCSPLALFDELRKRPDFEDWTCVWVVDDPERVPRDVAKLGNVVFVKKHGDAYLRHLASARFLVNNATFPSYFVRRPDQFYLNTWHGTPLKAMGKDIRSSFLERKNTVRNFLQATHLLSPNRHTSRVLLERHDIGDSFRGKLLEMGYPRIDKTLDPEVAAATRRRLGIENGRRVVLFAPTFRGTLGAVKHETADAAACIEMLRTLDCHVLFRGHYFVERSIAGSKWRDCVVPEDVDTNAVLGIVDVLVTDYSSVAFDFMVTERPIVYYVDDLQKYSKERGLYLSIGDLPGDECPSIDAVHDAVARCLAKPPDEERRKRMSDARARFCSHDDGRVSLRVLEIFLDGREYASDWTPSGRRSLLLHVGNFKPNGITTSALNLLRSLNPDEVSVTVGITPLRVSAHPSHLGQFALLPEHVQVIGTVGDPVGTREELALLAEFDKRHSLASAESRRVLECYFRREYERSFGSAYFDVLVDFNGYDRRWLSAFASACGDVVGRKVVYLHNSMLDEWQMRFPSLECCFRQYDRFDSLVSVSDATCELNRRDLGHRFGLPAEKFTFCDNVHDADRVLRLAREEVDAETARLFEGASVVVTMGRLSVEKDHAKLIRAFSRLRPMYPDAKLLILGDGPLRERLARQIDSSGLEGKVVLLGHRENPFAVLARAKGFVLSSNHEGQPMVLLEALILGKPVVATDIVGNRSVLEGRAGLLVPNDEDGVLDGLSRLFAGDVPVGSFQNDDYQRNASRMFYERVLYSGKSRGAEL